MKSWTLLSLVILIFVSTVLFAQDKYQKMIDKAEALYKTNSMVISADNPELLWKVVQECEGVTSSEKENDHVIVSKTNHFSFKEHKLL